MTLTEGLLVVIVIVLTILVFTNQSARGDSVSRTWDCVDRSNGEITSVKMQYADKSSPEKNALRENTEYFTAASGGSDVLSYQCDDNGTFPYATNTFGASGMDYKDWVAAQAIDPQVVQNHKAFVADRMSNNTQNVTGPTLPSEMEDVSAVPWVGLRRVEAVPTSANAGALQVPDIDLNAYATKPTFTWSSS